MTKQKARSSGADPAQRSGEGTQLRRRSGARDPEKAHSSGREQWRILSFYAISPVCLRCFEGYQGPPWRVLLCSTKCVARLESHSKHGAPEIFRRAAGGAAVQEPYCAGRADPVARAAARAVVRWQRSWIDPAEVI